MQIVSSTRPDGGDRILIVAVHEGTDQLAAVHVATSEAEAAEVVRVASSIGPTWRFTLADVDGVPLQWWSE